MKFYRFFFITLLNIFLFQLSPVTAYANSSWRWISERRPYDVFPFVIVLTLLIEILYIKYSSDLNNALTFVLSISVIIGNILSFAAPYFFNYIIPGLYTFEELLEHTPFYIVGIVYLLVTLIIEVPIVFCLVSSFMYEAVLNSKKLFTNIIIANTITTILTAVTERILCPGSW